MNKILQRSLNRYTRSLPLQVQDFAPINVHLLDTPGFDDTYRSDTDVLKEIACWLTKSYQHKVKLSGILYLHRISDNRITGTARTNLRVFQKICGPDAFKNILLVTTMWEKVNPADGESREMELENSETFWGQMIKEGACTHRHQNTKTSVLTILKRLVDRYIDRAGQEVALTLQTEMVNGGKELSQTDAGKELDSGFQKEREELLRKIESTKNEMTEERDKEMIEIYREQQEERNKALERNQKDSEALRVSMEKLHEEKMQKLQEEIQLQQNKHSAQMNELKDTLKSEKSKAQRRQEARDATVAAARIATEHQIQQLERRISLMRFSTSQRDDSEPYDYSSYNDNDYWYCNECSRNFVNEHAISQHNDAIHSGYSNKGSNYNQAYCNRCSRSFVDNDALHQHNEAKHSDGPWKCYDCGRGFVDRQALFQHKAAKH